MGLFSKDREDPQRITIATGAELHCQVCSFDRFFDLADQFKPMTVFVNLPAKCHVCGRCGYVHWFLA